MNKGFVYILTNPSFREDWVKIGKSSRPVDIRSKELDNTAVPLPFEIYATVQTSKYSEIEAKMHKILTNLADARIRKNREFFNIMPADAFGYLKDLAELTDDAVINAPDDLDDGQSRVKGGGINPKKYIVDTDELFYLVTDVAKGVMRVEGGSDYVVQEGSTINPTITSNEKSIRAMRKNLADSLSEDGLTVIKDTHFKSPSAAAEFIRGGSCNGKTYWRTRGDVQLNDFIRYSD